MYVGIDYLYVFFLCHQVLLLCPVCVFNGDLCVCASSMVICVCACVCFFAAD